ncbi:MAG: NAD(P)-dependent oxidoreductase [Desulfobacterales bacterium]|jgi:3-hydroxyisobutyrate dehydrogenase
MTEGEKWRLGWIGTGVMGRWMCQHLVAAGYPVVVNNRTPAKAQPLIDSGATWAENPSAVAQAADVVFTMIGFPEDVEAVYFGDKGILEASRKGTILVDMTTTRPSLAKRIDDAAREHGAVAIDAPVSGGDVGAKNAKLSIMVGGDRQTAERLTPLFDIMGKTVVYQGPSGAGQHTKMCNQIVIAGTMIGVCESLVYGYRAGLDLEVMLSSISGGAAACWSLDNLAPRILNRNFDPGFYVDHFVKDMGIALDEARRMGVSLPGLALVNQLYLSAKANGHGRSGTHALMLALEQMSGIEP